MMEPFVRIHQGHVMDRLREMPDRSVHCIITSPPYHGIRAYGTEPQVWGGAECEHVWGEKLPAPAARHGTIETLSAKQRSSAGTVDRAYLVETQGGAFCQSCGAWRGELGSEPSVGLFIEHLVDVFRECRRVLRDDGLCFVNVGDSYSTNPAGNNSLEGVKDTDGAYKRRRANQTEGTGDNEYDPQRRVRFDVPPKNLQLVPERLAIALQDDGWIIRNRIIWAKGLSFCDTYAGSVMPESCKDRFTKAHEHVWMCSKKPRYYFDLFAVMEDGISSPYSCGQTGHHGNNSATGDGGKRQPRDVWAIGVEPSGEAHYASYPRALVRPMIRCATSEKGVCPQCGAPWRQVEARANYTRMSTGKSADYRDNTPVSGGATRLHLRPETLGWSPGCSCHAGDPIPATVCDPFLGSGTTAVVAVEEGRSCVGIELQPKYVAIAERRINDALGLFGRVEV